MDFTDPTRMTSSPDIKVTTSNVTVMNGVAKFSGNGYIRTSVALTEAAGGCPVTVRLTYKENKRSRQVRVVFIFFLLFLFLNAFYYPRSTFLAMLGIWALTHHLTGARCSSVIFLEPLKTLKFNFLKTCKMDINNHRYKQNNRTATYLCNLYVNRSVSNASYIVNCTDIHIHIYRELRAHPIYIYNKIIQPHIYIIYLMICIQCKLERDVAPW